MQATEQNSILAGAVFRIAQSSKPAFFNCGYRKASHLLVKSTRSARKELLLCRQCVLDRRRITSGRAYRARENMVTGQLG